MNILAFTEIGETDGLFAKFDTDARNYICNKIFDQWFDLEEDDNTTLNDIEMMIKQEVTDKENHCIEFGPFMVRSCRLNSLFDGETVFYDDPDFEIKKGTKVYEAALHVTMGCDAACALEAMGYFTRIIDCPELSDYEWVERTLA